MRVVGKKYCPECGKKYAECINASEEIWKCGKCRTLFIYPGSVEPEYTIDCAICGKSFIVGLNTKPAYKLGKNSYCCYECSDNIYIVE